ncbi:MAG: flagellar motor protein MotB [Burkholderiales bacterium]|nr:flagellar motor protein MotB [Burkholderiales bacterium]
MANDAKKLQPIIVKKIKKGGHAAHGGAWKIAYADFVTAMMAFFLLMWLLGSTAQGDLKGIADYFNSPLKIAMSGGSGSGDSSSILKGGGQDLTRQTGQVKHGDEPPEKKTYNLQAAKAEAKRAERVRLERLKQRVEAMFGANGTLSQFKNQVRLDITSEGLRIQIVDEQDRAMFDSGRAVLKDHARLIIREIGRSLTEAEQKIGISGHTDATPFPGGDAGYGNWDLSTDRANAARRELMAAGLPEARILRVVGLASSVPLTPNEPNGASNRRISIVVMNRDAEEAILRDGPVVDVDHPESVSNALGAGALSNSGREAMVAPAPPPPTSLLRAPIR